MDATIWTIIGTAVGLFVALSAVMQLSIMSLRNELRAEFRQAIAELRAEFKQDIAELRTEFKQDIAELRAEFKQDLAVSSSDVNSRIQSIRAEIIANRRILYRFSLHRHGDDGLPLAPLTDALEPPDFGGGDGESGNPPA